MTDLDLSTAVVLYDTTFVAGVIEPTGFGDAYFAFPDFLLDEGATYTFEFDVETESDTDNVAWSVFSIKGDGDADTSVQNYFADAVHTAPGGSVFQTVVVVIGPDEPGTSWADAFPDEPHPFFDLNSGTGGPRILAARYTVEGGEPVEPDAVGAAAFSGRGYLGVVPTYQFLDGGTVTLGGTATLTANGFHLRPGRWQFYDPETGDLYSFEMNPNKMTTPHRPDNVRIFSAYDVPRTTNVGGTWSRVLMGKREPFQWQFSGRFRSETQYEAFVEWLGKHTLIHVKDHFERTFLVRLTDLELEERKPTRYRDWRFQYTFTAYMHGEL